ncbi:MAG: DUF3575 domain-containing protein [Bacteroidetes bacterium]|uniref:DUF3575 domain-containing protein n=1 Tax=Candidatus Cryptobacteroides avistercoris TaxID=2840758 RepID=A0A9D9IWV6_9BACT|nr:DUF3575 domain-containing protein [Candidatus Cryptobacteroides avistercoris]
MKKILIAAAALLCCQLLQAQNFALSTNVLGYADFGTLNIEASYGVSRHWTVAAGVRYNPFSFGSGEDTVRRKQRSLSAGTRYWPWHIFSGWWLSAELGYQEYNSGGLSSPKTSEGDRFGAGLGGGYTYMLGPHLNLDFGIGFWSGYESYTTYDCQTCGRKIASGQKFFFLPSELVLALTYIF